MDFFDKLDKSGGGYIFISHSHDDIAKIRELRNSLEESGFEPLCFYLKCLNDDSEIEDLIKREIDAREWFVFADSENSRKSKWVTLEREYIKQTDSKKILAVNIEDEVEFKAAIRKIKHNLRIFLSYSSRDRALVKRIKDRLEERDYLAFWNEDFRSGESYVSQIVSNIERACRDGCVIVIITENSIRSNHIMTEIKLAIERGGNVLPVIVGNVDVGEELKFLPAEMQCVFMSENPTDEEICRAVDAVGNIIVNK